ncbi:uncharacterized protein LOC114723360 [Neltuma alba]|uniref:uncharacterized protein LOC114723360 n=1 Tax=Neltuma alba TaxID=207710 RepID=UPI0010A3B4A3|nr:uncharacterized protein LOC114723360 [Prosopis alba]
MNEIESLKLFSWHAFKQEAPLESFIELSKNVVAYYSGLPPALEVLGSYLFDIKIEAWEDVLSKLRRIPNDEIQAKLKETKLIEGISLKKPHEVCEIDSEAFKRWNNGGWDDSHLAGDQYPDWFIYESEGRSVIFKVPVVIGCHSEAMLLNVVYSPSTDITMHFS